MSGRGRTGALGALLSGTVVLVALLMGCGGSDPAPTASPLPLDAAQDTEATRATTVPGTFPPTWTPSQAAPSTTPAPSPTPAPSFTPRPSVTSTPGLTPGALRDGDEVIVTVLTERVNTALADAFAAASIEGLTGAPVLALDFGSQVSVQMTFYNAFLDQSSSVRADLRLAVRDGALSVEEVADTRTVEGPLIVEQDWRAALRLVGESLHALAVRMADEAAGAESGPLRVMSVRVFPDHLRVTLERDAPVG